MRQIAVLSCLLFLPLPAIAAETRPPPNDTTAVARDLARNIRADDRACSRTLVVELPEGGRLADVESGCYHHGYRFLGPISPGSRFGRVLVPAGEGIETACQRLIRSGVVEHAEPDYVVTPQAGEPNDPLLGDQWGLRAIRAVEAWPLVEDGSDIIVAVLDSGFDLDHPDLAGRIAEGIDLVDGDAIPEDGYGHGTYVAGIIGAVQDNGVAIAGVARRVKLMPIRVLNDQGAGLSSNLAAGIRWAADHGAKVINISVGSFDPSAVVLEAVAYAAAKGALIVAAAGNSNGDRPIFPAAFDQVLSVTGVDQNLDPAGMASGPTIDLAAPAVNVVGLDLDGGIQRRTGTSSAAAHVSGLAV